MTGAAVVRGGRKVVLPHHRRCRRHGKLIWNFSVSIENSQSTCGIQYCGLRLQPLTGALSAYSAKNARWHPSSLHEQLFSKYASSRHIEHALSFVYFGLSPFSPLKCAVVDAGRRFHLWMRQMGHSEVCDLIFAILQLPHFTLLHVVGLHVTDNFKMRGVATMDVEEISWSANNRSVNSRASRPSVSDNKPAWFEVCEEDLVLSQSWNVFQGWSAVRMCRWWRLFALIFSVCVLFRFLCVRDTCLDYNIVIYMTTGQLLAKYKVITQTPRDSTYPTQFNAA